MGNYQCIEKRHEGPVLDRKAGYDVIDCTTCGFAHLSPIPDPALLDRIYREQYYDTDIPDYISRHHEDRLWWNMVYSQRFDAFERLLPATNRTILDIGSGPGLFLLNGVRRGWRALGFEPSRKAWEHATQCLGLDVRNQFFSPDSVASLAPFDVVHASEVFEHLVDPAEMLAAIRKVLSPGGALCLVVPNDYNPIQMFLRDRKGFSPWWVSPPHHINYFTFDSLTRLLERSGFTTRVREATFPIELFLMLGLDYTENDELGRRCHGWRMRMERNLYRCRLDYIRKMVYRGLAQLGLGRHIMLIATVPGSKSHGGRS